MGRSSTRVAGCIRPEDVYRWPNEIAERLGLVQSGRRPSGDSRVRDLVRIGGLRPHKIGNVCYVFGADVISALRVCSSSNKGIGHERQAGDSVRSVGAETRAQVQEEGFSGEKE
jgi:hypothetical protein